ncbi:hypothetical protein ACN9MZ_23965 [Pseudoduganella sp. S-14]|uniref:hypothetical protein n=1 Tax=Pseudoduganella sp. S-14 TaxID=3404065 RepID=UPI003CF0A7AA
MISGSVADAKHIYFGMSDTNLPVGLDKRTGQPVLEHDTKVWTCATPVLAGAAAYGASMRGELFALDAATGRQQLSWRTPGSLADDFGLLDAKSGKFDSRRLFEGPQPMLASVEHVKRLGAYISTPAWHDGQLIAVTADGRTLFFR